jgi:hypothetical protein
MIPLPYFQEVGKPQVQEDRARAAIFYSIDATQLGLSGIDLGHLLLKGVVQILRAELPNLEVKCSHRAGLNQIFAYRTKFLQRQSRQFWVVTVFQAGDL